MVFHKYKLLFVGIPKNGSMSVSETLMPNSDNAAHSHASIKKLIADYPETKDYYKATIKRNPYIRALSAYTMMSGKCKTLKDKIKIVYEHHLSYIPPSVFENQPNSSIVNYYYENKMESVFIPQYYYITDSNKIILDEILCLENIEEDWLKFSNKFVDMPKSLIVKNKTPIRDCEHEWQSHYDSETIQMVNYLYKYDFELLNYPMLQP
jgi:hypothetical protein